MSRKRPSRHTEDQFALFMEKIRESLGDDEDSNFHDAVNRLVRPHQKHEAEDHELREPRRSAPRAPLPERPAFEAIEHAAQSTLQARKALMTLIGQLVFSWSNNESLLIYVLMLLLGTDERSAAVVYSTLNTTRARLELVRRLTLLKVADSHLRSELDSVVERFNDANRTRNEFLHAMYSVNRRGEITHTQTMRFVEKGGQFSFGDRQPVDEERLRKLDQAHHELLTLNRNLWDLLPRLRATLVD
jgi:hypothetical protein